jgi:quercetin dioxygenase-like cupin family protein
MNVRFFISISIFSKGCYAAIDQTGICQKNEGVTSIQMKEVELMSIRTLFMSCTLLLISSISASAQVQEPGGKPPGQNLSDMKFVTVPGLPTCALNSVQSGDPTKAPSIILGKLPTGCTVPWHWHAPNEHLMLVSGRARLEMKDGKAFTLRAGGFAVMPSRHIHQFRCEQNCLLYVYSDGAFDIHYVDEKGNEIAPDKALKAVKGKTETPR